MLVVIDLDHDGLGMSDRRTLNLAFWIAVTSNAMSVTPTMRAVAGISRCKLSEENFQRSIKSFRSFQHCKSTRARDPNLVEIGDVPQKFGPVRRRIISTANPQDWAADFGYSRHKMR